MVWEPAEGTFDECGVAGVGRRRTSSSRRKGRPSAFFCECTTSAPAPAAAPDAVAKTDIQAASSGSASARSRQVRPLVTTCQKSLLEAHIEPVETRDCT